MILPATGVVSEVFICFARRRFFGYGFMVLIMIGVVGSMVWGHRIASCSIQRSMVGA